MIRFALLCALFFSLSSLAQDELKDIYKNYISGQYQVVLDELAKFKTQDSKLKSTKTYWEGLCHSRLGNYREAVKKYLKALEEGNRAQDIHYEQGQAYYALNELEQAKKAFSASIQNQFKKATSYYYIGHISQLLENYPEAKKAYENILKDAEAETSLLQFARFQIGEVLLSIAEQKEEQKENKMELSLIVSKHVLPQLEKAIQLAPSSNTASDIKRRIDEIKRQYGLDPNVLKNGRQLTPRVWDLELSQKISYDNNITQATDLPTIRATQKDSFIFDTEAFAKYRFVYDRSYVLTPELRATRTKYGDQKTPEVFTNDSYTFAPALRSRYEHKLFGEMAATLLDFEYNYTLRDKNANHENHYYGKTYTEAIGEKFKFFSFGETTLKLKIKHYFSYDSLMDSKGFVPSISQIIFIPRFSHLLLVYFQSDMTKVRDHTQNATNTLLRFDYIVPEFKNPLWSLQGSFAITWTDPEVGKDTRGVEKTYNPGVKLTRNINSNFQASLSHDYSKKTSLDKATYAYTKNVTAFELRYAF